MPFPSPEAQRFYCHIVVGLLMAMLLLPRAAWAQEEEPKKKKGDRIREYFAPSRNPYKGRIIPVPLIAYSPETSWGFGIGAQYLFRTPSTDSTGNLSIGGFAFKYTLKKQFIVNPYWDIFWKKDQWRLTGAALWQRYPDSFFGVGNGTPLKGERYTSDYILVRNRVTRQILPKLQMGLQYRLEHMYRLRVQEGGLFDQTEVSGGKGYTASGLGSSFIFDTRDHNLYPFRGWYIIFSHHTYSRYFGGNTDVSSFRVDVRGFWNPGHKSHILAFQAVTQLHTGTPPFKMMSTFGENELMRGYFYGRFRDKHMVALQGEYRFPIVWRFIGVAFAGVGNTFGPYSNHEFKSLKFAGGGGIRFTLDAKERINIRFDAGFGLDGSKGFYFTVGEAF